MIRRIGARSKTDSSGTKHRITALLGLLLTVAPLIQGQTTKPSDVFFYDAAHPDQRGFPYNIGTSFAPKNQKPAASIVAKGVVLRGWLELDENVAVVTFKNAKFEDAGGTRFLGYEDVHYKLALDYDFINSTYGQNGAVLNGAVLHGNPIDSQTSPIPLADHGNGTLSGIGINSFWLPNSGGGPFSLGLVIGMELNAWHARASHHCSYILGQQVGCDAYENYAGRGPAPPGWVERDLDYASSLPAVAADNWWPFDPDDPDGLQSVGTGVVGQRPGPDYQSYQSCIQNCEDNCPDNVRKNAVSASCKSGCNNRCTKQFPHAFTNVLGPVTVPKYLQQGDYVEVQGTLWQDSAHDAGQPTPCWGKPLSFHNQDGWLEIHPVDSIRRIPAPGPSPHSPYPNQDLLGSAKAGVKRVVAVQLCSDEQGVSNGPSTNTEVAVCPDSTYVFGDPRIHTRIPQPLVPHVLELIGYRFTNTSMHGRGASVVGDCVNIEESLPIGVKSALYKVTYVVWWTPGPATITGKTATTSTSGTNLTLQNLQNVQLPLSASACPTLDRKSCLQPGQARPRGSPLMDIVTVTSNGTPVGGATVSVSGQNSTALTNASGEAVITYQPCLTQTHGPTGVPVAVPTPCGAAASKAGYQPFSIGLP